MKSNTEISACKTIKLFNRIELWWRKGVWFRTDEYVFSFSQDCANKCIMIELGFFGITILRNECVGME